MVVSVDCVDIDVIVLALVCVVVELAVSLVLLVLSETLVEVLVKVVLVLDSRHSVVPAKHVRVPGMYPTQNPFT